MSRPNDTPVFKEPTNFDTIRDIPVRPTNRELLLSSPDVTVCKYAVCLSTNDTSPGLSPEEKDFTIQFFGNIRDLLRSEDSLRTMPFDEFMQLIRDQSGVNGAQQANIWVTGNLTTPARRIAGPSSDRQFADAMINYNDAFRRDRENHAILYFFVDFDGPSHTIPSKSSRQHTAPPFLGDQAVDHYAAVGGVSPRHQPAPPSGYDPSRNFVTRPRATLPVNNAPVPPPAQLKRSNTLETGKKAINKLVVTVKSAPGIVKALVSPRDAPQEQPTILTELASHIEHEEYLTSLLPKTKGSPEHQARADAYQIQQFEHFARFFAHIDPKQRENTRSIHFRHTALAVTPHQFTRAMQILFQDHTTGLAGGILASEMGTGKSYVILCAVVIRALLFESKRRVEREWEEAETRAQSSRKGSSSRPVKLEHLPRDAPGGRNLKCPTLSHRAQDVICFCQPDGATRNEISRLKPGAALIQVPSASMPGWIETLESCLFSRMSYNLTVLYSGPRLSSRIQPNPDFLRGKNFNSWKMGAALPEGHPGGLVSKTEDLTFFAQPAPLSDRLNMSMETYIVVTTHNGTRLRDLYSWDVGDLSPAPQNCRFPDGGLYAYPIGLTFIDEAHKVLDKDSVPLKMAAFHRRVLPTLSTRTVGDVWLVSGTPFGAQLKDLVAAVSDLAPDRASDGTALLEAYDAIEPAMTNTPRAIFETHFKRVFGDQLVYRDDRETTFMGSRITDIQNVRPQYISRQTPQSQLHSMRMLIATHVTVGPRDAYFDTLQKLKQNTQLLYLLSMFPSAAKLLLDSPDTPFLELDIRRTIRKEKNTTGESLAGNRILRSLAEKLARSPRSPKLQFILDELDRMGKDRTARPQVAQARAGAQTQETDLALKKMVVITPTLFTAVMLYMILARFHPRTGPLLYHEDLKQSQRSDALRRFNSLRKRDGPWRVFIAPASVASEALNLQIANRLILTSPLLDTHQESQALARVNRVGQSFDVHLKILLLEDSPLDRIVVAHRAGAKFLSDPFNVAEDVSVVNLNADSGSTLI